MSGYEVYLYIYDLSQGAIKHISPLLLGKQIDGIWHTSVVVYGREYLFGGLGIENFVPETTPTGRPIEKLYIGKTYIDQRDFAQYLNSIKDKYSPAKYNLRFNNCNNFSKDVCKFLTGQNIPSYITDLPDEVLSTPFGRQMLPYLETMEANMQQNASVPSASSFFGTVSDSFSNGGSNPAESVAQGISRFVEQEGLKGSMSDDSIKKRTPMEKEMIFEEKLKKVIFTNNFDENTQLYISRILANISPTEEEKEFLRNLKKFLDTHSKKQLESASEVTQNFENISGVIDFFHRHLFSPALSSIEFQVDSLSADICESKKMFPLYSLLRLLVAVDHRIADAFCDEKIVEFSVSACEGPFLREREFFDNRENKQQHSMLKTVILSFLCNLFRPGPELESRGKRLASNYSLWSIISSCFPGESQLTRKTASSLLSNCCLFFEDEDEEKNVVVVSSIFELINVETDLLIKKRIIKSLCNLMSHNKKIVELVRSMGYELSGGTKEIPCFEKYVSKIECMINKV